MIRLKVVSLVLLPLLLVGMLMLTSNVQPAKAESLPLVSLNPIEYTAGLGESFTINVTIANVTDMKGFHFMLGYNNALLEATRVYPTPITEDATDWIPVNATAHFNFDRHPVINNTRTYAPDYAYVWVGAIGFTSFTGSGAVFTINFTATARGSCTLDLFLMDPPDFTFYYPDRVEVLNSTYEQIPHTTLDGSVSVLAPVGGIYIPVNKLSLLAPYIGLTTLLAVAVVTAGYVKKRKRNTEISS